MWDLAQSLVLAGVELTILLEENVFPDEPLFISIAL